jgi:hypothetical protein
MATTSEKILQSIKETHLAPAPRWKFRARNSVIWTMFAVALLVGSLSLSVIIDQLVNHDWDIYRYLHKTFLQYLLLSLPYLWIVCAAVFSLLAYYYFVHTRGWYRHRVYRVVLASIGLSVALGTAFFFLGFGKQLDAVLASKVPYYQFLSVDKKKLWTHPDEGLLGGQVTQAEDSSGDFVIKDYSGNDWDVQQPVATPKDPAITVGEDVKIIGVEKNPQTFEAKEVRQWEAQTKKETAEDSDSSRSEVKGVETHKQTYSSDKTSEARTRTETERSDD